MLIECPVVNFLCLFLKIDRRELKSMEFSAIMGKKEEGWNPI